MSLPITDRNTIMRDSTGSEPQADQALYQSAIGTLTWIAKCTRPDISYVVGQLSQHYSAPTTRHWNAALRVLRYLKGTLNYSITYSNREAMSMKLVGFTDADYAGDIIDRHSVSGYIYLLYSGPITWNSTKQRCVATSTTESEYIALAEASKQAQWLRTLLRELQYPQYLGDDLAVKIYSDNQACIAIAKDPISHSRTKHIDVRYHYIRELVTYNKVAIEYLSTKEMVADMLTKPLSFTKLQHCFERFLGNREAGDRGDITPEC